MLLGRRCHSVNSLLAFLLVYIEAAVPGETSVLYKAIYLHMTYAEAETYSENTGGDLAKLTVQLNDNNKNPKIYQKILGSVNNFWIGLSDRKNEGDWRWFDGTPVVEISVNWAYHNAWVLLFQAFTRDCGKVYTSKQRILWDMSVWSLEKYFICQYEIEKTTQRPTSMTRAWKDDSVLRKNTAKPTVFRKVWASAYISSPPLAVKDFPSVTFCLRECVNNNKCLLFNFNSGTGSCAIFGIQLDDISFTENPHWEIWTAKYHSP